MTMTSDDIKALRAQFPAEAHSVREGPATKDKSKCMWFIYLDRNAISERLDDLFPGEWEFFMTEPVQREGHFSSVGTLTIKGVTRQFNGTQEIDTESWGKAWDDEKGCGTDTFRRVASMWGIGAYLYKAPDMWTAKPGKNDWDAQKKAKAEVIGRLNSWLSRTNEPSNITKLDQPPAAATETKWPSSETVTWVLSAFTKDELSDTEIFKLAGVKSFDDGDGWRKYATPQEAVTAIAQALDDEIGNENLDNGNGEMVETFRYMSYIGKTSTLQFMTNEPGTDNNTCAVLYGGRGAIKKWNAELHEQLNLDQYKAIKDENIVSDFIEMAVHVPFYFVGKKHNDGEDYFEITGIEGNPVIPF